MSEKHNLDPDRYIPDPWAEIERLRTVISTPAGLRAQTEKLFPEYVWEDKAYISNLEIAAEQLDRLKRDCKRLVHLLNIQEDSELTGRSFRPNQITSCRAMDGREIGEILERMGNL
jgi:hypothetical protein